LPEKNLAKDKYSSLFFRSVNDDEEKVLPEKIFQRTNTENFSLSSLTLPKNKPECLSFG
jgi:hypothetical protein